MQIARQFGGAYSEYLIFYSDETRQSLGSDANLNLTWDELRIKIIRWERFARTHQQLPETETAIKPMIQNMLSLYMEGMDNTPAYDARIGGTGKIDEELRNSYITFLKENKDSQYYDLIQGIYAILKKHNYKLNSELISFVHNKDIAAFEGTSVREFVEKN